MIEYEEDEGRIEIRNSIIDASILNSESFQLWIDRI